MNNKTRIIIGVVIAILFVIGIVALVQTQTNVTNSTKITNQNDTQIQNNSTDTIEIESLTIVKYALNNDKSSKVNTKPKSTITDKYSKVNTNSKSKSIITDKSSKVNTNSKNKSVNVANDDFNTTLAGNLSEFESLIHSPSHTSIINRGSENPSDVIKYGDNVT